MVKRTMYFKDEKQAKIISKINDKIHKKRGVIVSDESDVEYKTKKYLLDGAQYLRLLAIDKRVDSNIRNECKQLAANMVGLAQKLGK